MSHSIPMQESISDPDAPGGFVQLINYDGGFFPGKKPSPVIFKGYDETVINVVPEENPSLYNFLTLTPRLVGGITSNRQVPTKIELLRPNAEVEANIDDDEKQADIILQIRDASHETLQYLAPKLFLPADTSTQQRMKKNFIDYVKLKPENVNKLAALFEADETLIYQQVEQAIQGDIIAVNPDKGVWVLSNNQQVITPASAGKNHIDQLVGYLVLEQDQPTLRQIIALLGDAEVAPAAADQPRRGGRPPKKK